MAVQVLVARPKTLSPADKGKLRKAGVLVVEAEDPQSVRLISAEPPAIPGDAILRAALIGANQNYDGQKAFTKAMLDAMQKDTTDAGARG